MTINNDFGGAATREEILAAVKEGTKEAVYAYLRDLMRLNSDTAYERAKVLDAIREGAADGMARVHAGRT